MSQHEREQGRAGDRALANVTITLDPETAGKARIKAAEAGMSLSRYVGEVLRERLASPDSYERAMRRYLARGPFKQLQGKPQRHPGRDELHERDLLRRR